MSACLKHENHNVKMLFLVKDYLDKYENSALGKVVELVKDDDLIGISLMTNFFDNVVQITKYLKRDLSIPIVWGGIHATIRPEECLNYADMVCIGEAEETLVELVKKIEKGHDHRDVQGVWLKDKGNTVRNKLRPLIQDLDSIPFQDYDYGTHYIIEDAHIYKMSEDLVTKYTLGDYLTFPTRGCPFGCSYCNNNILNKMYPDQQTIRRRSIDNVIKELQQAKINLPFMRRMYFNDDAFFLYSVGEIEKFCQEYKKNIKLDLVVAGATPVTLMREKLSPLVDAGLQFMRMGIQTGSERTKKLYRRNYSNQQVIEAAKTINGFTDKMTYPQYDIIVDNPWETDEDITETLKLLTRITPPYRLSILSLAFYPQTELYDKAKNEGIIGADLDTYRKSYTNCKESYFNKLFFLLNLSRGRISTKTISLLTNRAIRKFKLHWPLYWVVKFKIVILALISDKDMRKVIFSRIMKIVPVK